MKYIVTVTANKTKCTYTFTNYFKALECAKANWEDGKQFKMIKVDQTGVIFGF